MTGFVSWLRELRTSIDSVSDGNGLKVLTQLSLTYLLYAKGIASNLVMDSFYIYYIQILRVDANVTNSMMTVALSPYGLKTLWAAVSDVIPVMWFNKKYYIVFGGTVSVLCLVSLAAFPPADASVATLLFFGFFYGVATVDSLTQARYTELMNQANNPSIVSYVWGNIQMAAGIGGFTSLLLVFGNKTLLWIAIPCTLPMILPSIMNFLKEKPGYVKCRPDFAKVTQNKGPFVLSMILAAAVLAGNVLVLFTPGRSQLHLAYYIAVSIIVLVVSFRALPAAIAKPNLYMFLCAAMRLTIDPQLQAFYTSPNGYGSPSTVDGPICFHDSPGFSVEYYQTVANIARFGGGILALMFFQKFMLSWKVRFVFWSTTFLCCVAAFLDLIIVERWNHTIFGTTAGSVESQWVDKVFFLFGAQGLTELLTMLDFVPGLILIGKLCPKNIEATIYAVLAAMNNFGTSVSRVAGTMVINDVLGITLRIEDGYCVNEVRFGVSSLGWAKIIGFMLLPALTIPITFLLLPDCTLDDDVLGRSSNETPSPRKAGGSNLELRKETTGDSALLDTLDSFARQQSRHS